MYTERILKRLSVLIMFFAFILPVAALAQIAPEYTKTCVMEAQNGGKSQYLRDNTHTRVWVSKKGGSLTLTTKEKSPLAGLYLAFRERPSGYTLSVEINGEWVDMGEGDLRYYQVYLPLPECTSVRVKVADKEQFNLTQMRLFGPGDLPEDVHVWQDAPEECDMLFMSTHPDDEILFLGGVLTQYAKVEKKTVVVSEMAIGIERRMNELLDGIWHCGVRYYPIIGPFRDRWSNTLKKGYEEWDKEQIESFMIEAVRRTKPQIIVTQDLGGEYGHGAHMVTSRGAIFAYENAGDADVFPESAAVYGTWEPKKIYVHMYPEGAMTFDFRQPLKALEGRTILEVVKEAFELHETQRKVGFRVEDLKETGISHFGLYASRVGADEAPFNFFENID